MVGWRGGKPPCPLVVSPFVAADSWAPLGSKSDEKNGELSIQRPFWIAQEQKDVSLAKIALWGRRQNGNPARLQPPCVQQTKRPKTIYLFPVIWRSSRGHLALRGCTSAGLGRSSLSGLATGCPRERERSRCPARAPRPRTTQHKEKQERNGRGM